MQYVAKQKGFWDGSLLQVGDTFEATNFDGKWAVPVKSYKPEPEETQQVLAEKAREGLQGPKGKKTSKKKVKKKKG